MDTARDKNGKTEAEFLRDYDVTKYFRPSVTVDAVLFCRTERGIKLLMIERGGHPYLGMYAFPGGFVDSDEPCEVAASRELMEETGITDVKLRQLITASTPGRDPRWRNITVVFAAETDRPIKATAGDDAAKAKWFDVAFDGEIMRFSAAGERFTCTLSVVRDAFGMTDLNKTTIVKRGKIAFDHAKIISYLFDVLRGE